MDSWTTERAWDWHKRSPWLRGCNFIGSDCCNRIDQWQEFEFEKRMETAEREMSLAHDIGYNLFRLILQFEVWDREHDSFLHRFERYLAAMAKNGISAMICFANDCSVPKELYSPPQLGKQHVDRGCHGGLKKSPHTGYTGAVGYTVLDDPELRKRFFLMEREIVERYAHDSRVAVWDLFNEPGNGNRGEVSAPHVQTMFDIAREINPEQPLTSGVWTHPGHFRPPEETALKNSDIVSFHNCSSFDNMVQYIDFLKQYNRPLAITEWLHRIQHSDVQQMFPLFYLEKIHCCNWGFVAGLTQTYEPWDAIYKWAGEAPDGAYDLRLWQHDLFRANLRPYDPREIKIIKHYCKLADERRAAGR